MVGRDNYLQSVGEDGCVPICAWQWRQWGSLFGCLRHGLSQRDIAPEMAVVLLGRKILQLTIIPKYDLLSYQRKQGEIAGARKWGFSCDPVDNSPSKHSSSFCLAGEDQLSVLHLHPCFSQWRALSWRSLLSWGRLHFSHPACPMAQCTWLH